MRELHKKILDFDKALAFCTEALEGTNTFSDEILKIISQEKGRFFTLLPVQANYDQIHRFSSSILPQEPKQKGKIGNLPGIHTYAHIASTEKEFANFLYQLITMHSYEFMSDHYNSAYKEVMTKEWFRLYGMHYLEEVYYFLSPQNATPQLIEQCLFRSKTFWHSLSILSKKSGLDVTKKKLPLSEIREFCKSSEFVFVGAYDGEGYVVWEKG